MIPLTGRGSEHPLTDSEIVKICKEALDQLHLDRKDVLVLIPDHTRHARIALFFHILHELLGKRVRSLDFLIATGTHADMDPERIYQHVGITKAEHQSAFSNVRFFNHEHANPAALATIGTIPGDELSRLTEGLFNEPIPVTINKKVLEYDHILLVTPVVPHEAMGFAGGNKYFFPGIAGLDVVQTFHWLGALLTNLKVNGVKDTLTRRVIDRAARFITTPRTCFAFVVNDRDQPVCLFAGDPVESWSRAVDYSARLHITYVDRPYKKVLAITPGIYEDLWVGGKAMYKLEPVVVDGGELIIFGPQIRSISFMHEPTIRKIGYHVMEYFTRQWERFSKEPKLILAHSTNVKGIGSFKGEKENPRITVTLATSIPESVCREVNLGFRNYRSLELSAVKSEAEGDLLVVDNAGQNLYRLQNGG